IGSFAKNGTLGLSTVTIPTTGSVALSVATVDDGVGESDGSINIALVDGQSYHLSRTQRTASVAVADNEPVVSITRDAEKIVEGADSSFTLSVTPSLTKALSVKVEIGATGEYVQASATGRFDVSIPASGSVKYTVSTIDDDIAEIEGSVSATILPGPNYRIAESKSAASVTVSDNEPTVSVRPGPSVTEGGNATFTVSSTPAPSAPLEVMVEITQEGDFAAAGATGKKTVTIPTSGSVVHSVATVDDKVDESHGGITATLQVADKYAVSSNNAATVPVSDNDESAATPCMHDLAGPGEVSGEWTNDCRTSRRNSNANAEYYSFSLTSNGHVTIDLQGEYESGSHDSQDTYLYLRRGFRDRNGWVVAKNDDGRRREGVHPFSALLEQTLPAGDYTIEATTYRAHMTGPFTLEVGGIPQQSVDTTQTPVISISGGADINEGDAATFTITATPAQSAALTVSLTVSQRGDYAKAGTIGAKTVTIPTSGSVTHSVATVDDDVDEENGGITATLNSGQGYTVSSSSSDDTVDVSDDDVPEISITAGAAVDEGTAASFTITADPTPHAALSVALTVTQQGDYAAAGTTGAKTVQIPTGGSLTYTVATVNDNAVEADGSITATLNSGQGYTVSSSQGAGSVTVADNDVAAKVCLTTDAALLAQVKAKTQDPWGGARPDLLDMFTRSYNTMKDTDTYTVAQLKARPDKQESNWQGPGPNALWQQVYAELDRLEACRSTPLTPPPPPDPEISVSGGAGIVEGGSASFTISASPAPSAALTVTVAVTQSGDFGVSTGSNTVSIPTSGSAQLIVATTNDEADEPHGSVTATVSAGSGYTVSATRGAAIVTVSDNDDPPPTPEVRISAGPAVTEGGKATFTLTATPAPATALAVWVDVTRSGDFGVLPSRRGIAIGTSGTAQLQIGTDGDGRDEPNGSVTGTLVATSAYTVSSRHGAATVTILDDDGPPPPPPDPVISVTAGAGVTEGGSATFTITASPAPSAALTVTVAVTQSGDFGVSTGLKTISIPTSGSAELSIATVSDNVDEANGSVTATISAGSGYSVSSTQGAATVAVADDDDPPPATPEVRITAGAGVSEGGSASFTITASPAPESALAVSLTVTQTGNFGVTTGVRSLTIPTSGSVSLSIATVNDSTDEPNGSVTATLGSGTGYTVSSTQGAATVTVSDDDQSSTTLPTLTVSNGFGVEGGSLLFLVRLSQRSAQAVTVDYATQPLTATNAVDYVGVDSTLTFAAGQRLQFIFVSAKQDSAAEGQETLELVLTNPSGATIARDTGLGTILDDD
ncbi:MAG: hypothetical protein OXG27_15600, partial [Chloroflexi bacterium]|nr:hypothetical protein [Chloroflexota bacterium]